MSTTRMRDRIFAGLGAALFLVTASGFTILVVYNMVTGKDQAQTAQTETCAIDGNIATTVTLPAPEVYKPTGTVTELQVTDLTEGTGPAAKKGDCLQMKYYGTLASDGTVFDENFTQKTLLQFQLGASQVITGWDQGLIGMKEGGTRRLVIPSSLAYSEQGQGSIPANATLVFVVNLQKIKN